VEEFGKTVLVTEKRSDSRGSKSGRIVIRVSTTVNYYVSSALHPYGVAKLSTRFGCGKGRNVTSARWQVVIPYGMPVTVVVRLVAYWYLVTYLQ